MASHDPLKHEGEVRTTFTCTECRKGIVALIDYSINGNHVVECPHCGHQHGRVVADGRITDDRWTSFNGTDATIDVTRARRVWKHSDDALQMETSSAAQFIRQRWLEKNYR